MSDVKRLVYSFIQFLGDQLQFGSLTPDAAESLEVAIQCLESAYGIDHSSPTLSVSRPLLDIFIEATQNEKPPVTEASKEPTEDDKIEAERLKNEGNNLMKAEKYSEALEYYTRAIALEGRNAIYYSNRAAAHSKMNNHKEAIEDCKRAIQIDPLYSKAYGRMGLAYASLNQHLEAKECYEKAVKLEPENDSYLSNLAVAEEKLRETNLGSHGGGGGSGGAMPGFGMGGFDLGSLLQNPALMNMATQMMSDPNMQQLMSNLLSGTAASQSGTPGFEALLQAGQQLASQMQVTNPNLVNQLRQQMNSSNPNSSNPNSDSPGNSQNNQGL